MLKIALLDDYAGNALSMADWSVVEKNAEITLFREAIAPEDMPATLAPFDMICALRERASFTRETFEALPNLKVLVASDPWIGTIDYAAATDLGIEVLKGDAPDDLPDSGDPTGEFAWGLLVATVRQIPLACERLRRGEWWQPMGMALGGRTLGILGLGRYGARIAAYAHAFDMKVIAWSSNLTAEAAAAAGVERVEKDALFRDSDVVSIHYRFGERSRGMVGARELGLMKPTAYLINTSRGPIVDEAALIDALREKRIAGAGLDVFDREPLPGDHPLLTLDNVTATPHLGFVTEEAMRRFYYGWATEATRYVERGLRATAGGVNG